MSPSGGARLMPELLAAVEGSQGYAGRTGPLAELKRLLNQTLSPTAARTQTGSRSSSGVGADGESMSRVGQLFSRSARDPSKCRQDHARAVRRSKSAFKLDSPQREGLHEKYGKFGRVLGEGAGGMVRLIGGDGPGYALRGSKRALETSAGRIAYPRDQAFHAFLRRTQPARDSGYGTADDERPAAAKGIGGCEDEIFGLLPREARATIRAMLCVSVEDRVELDELLEADADADAYGLG